MGSHATTEACRSLVPCNPARFEFSADGQSLNIATHFLPKRIAWRTGATPPGDVAGVRLHDIQPSRVSPQANSILDSGLDVIHDDDVDRAWGGSSLDWLLFDHDLDYAR